MGTSAFDRAWDAAKPKPKPKSDFDAAWEAAQAPVVPDNPTPPAKPTTVDRLRNVGAGAQTAADAYSFGTIGLVDDALSALATSAPGTMRQNFEARRAERRTNRENLPTSARVASTVAGALANPVGAVIRAPQGAGLLARIAYGAGDAALQGGAMAGTEALDELSPEGMERAGRAGLTGATNAVAGTAGFRAGTSLLRGANTLQRVYRAPTLGAAALARKANQKEADNFFFGQVEREATTGPGTSPEMQAALAHPTVAPYAGAQRARPVNATATDAQIFTKSYKRMSDVQGRLMRQREGTADVLAKGLDDAEDIKLAKDVMRPASAGALPTFNTANAVHAGYRQQRQAFTEIADGVARILGKNKQKGKKIEFDSPEALEAGIRSMTPAQAEAGIEALLGRSKQTAQFSPTPLGVLYGLPVAALRTGVMPSQVNPYLRLLEKQAGRNPSVFDNPVVAERGAGALARTAGGMTGLLAPK